MISFGTEFAHESGMTPRFSYRVILVFMVSLAVLAPALIGSGCGGVEGKTVRARTIGSSSGATPLSPDYLRGLVAVSLGDANLVRRADLSGDGTERKVEIAIDRPPACADGSVEGTMAAFTSKTMADLFSYPEIASVTIAMYGLDQGTKSNDVAVRVVVDRATAQEIDWSMIGPMTISSMVSEYFIHPQIVENANTGNSGFGVSS